MSMQDLITKARGAKSPEELLASAKELGIELTAEEAEETFALLHKKGELAEEELENVSGGGCDTTVDGKSYRVVTSDLECFTGQFKSNWVWKKAPNAPGDYEDGPIYVTDHAALRDAWCNWAFGKNKCGKCCWLSFKGGIGYCSKS